MEFFPQAFLETAKKHPDFPCLEFEDKTHTYSEIFQLSLWIAKKIHLNFPDSDLPIVLVFSNQWEYIPCFLAVWICGKYFLPLDAGLPEAYRKKCITETRSSYSIDERIFHEWKKEFDSENFSFQIPDSFPYPKDRNLPAYLIYTSGSSGDPCGVLVTHSGIMNVLKKQIECFGLSPGKRTLSFLSISFDASLSEIGTSLLSGGTLVFRRENQNNLNHLSLVLNEFRITHAFLSPGILSTLTWEEGLYPETIITGGEKVSSSLLEMYKNKARLIIAYGPTETTICTHLFTPREDGDEVYLGDPIPGVETLILSSGEHPEEGELCITGDCLSLGYPHLTDLTKKRFVTLNGKRYFKTGDWVRKFPEGIQYIGRLERINKIRGFRIDPERIQKEIESLSLFRDVQIEVLETEKGWKIFLIYSEILVPDTTKIFEVLKKHLPNYWIPNYFIPRKDIPLNRSSKLDLLSLSSILPSRSHLLLPEMEPPVNEREKKIISLFQRILGPIEIGRKDSFQALGGDSLNFFQFLLLLEKEGWVKEATYFTPDTPISEISDKYRSSSSPISIQYHPGPKLLLKKEGNAEILISGSSGKLGGAFLDWITEEKNFDSLPDLLRNSHIYLPLRNPSFFKSHPRIHVLDWKDISMADSVQLTGLSNLKMIFHFAGNTNPFLSTEDLIFDNVSLTKDLLRWKENFPDCHFHHISTLAIFDSKTGQIPMEKVGLEEAPRKGYPESKYLSELLLESGRSRGVSDLFIHRLPQIISWKSPTKTSDLFTQFWQGILKDRIVPEWDDEKALNFQVLEKWIPKFIQNLSSGREVYHYSSVNLKWKDCKDLLKSNFPVRILSDQEYLEEIQIRRNSPSDEGGSTEVARTYFSQSIFRNEKNRMGIFLAGELEFLSGEKNGEEDKKDFLHFLKVLNSQVM